MPRTAVVTETYYLFDELTDSAKENARTWWRELEAQEYWFELDDTLAVSQILGIRISEHVTNMGRNSAANVFWSHSWSQGDGALFEGQYFNAKDAPEKIREYAPQDEKLHSIADRLFALQAKHFGLLFSNNIMRTGHNYYHSGCMNLDMARLDDQSGILADVEENPTQEALDHWFEDEKTLIGLMREFADWIFEQVKADYEWTMSDENVDECIKANEYEFDEEGHRA